MSQQARGMLPSSTGTGSAEEGGAGVPVLGRPAAAKPATGGLQGQCVGMFPSQTSSTEAATCLPHGRTCRGSREAQGWQCWLSRGSSSSWGSLQGPGLEFKQMEFRGKRSEASKWLSMAPIYVPIHVLIYHHPMETTPLLTAVIDPGDRVPEC